MLLEPGPDVGAGRQHGQVPLPGVVEAVAGQVGSESGALKPGLDLGVDEADPLAAEVVVDETRQGAADMQLIPGRGGIVGDDRLARSGCAGWVHGGNLTSPDGTAYPLRGRAEQQA